MHRWHYVCGLWHGASWTFVIWECYHGILLMIHRFFVGEKKVGVKSKFLNSNPGLFVKILLTQLLVFFGWMIFRAENPENLILCMQKIFIFNEASGFNSGVLVEQACLAGCVLLIVLFILMFSKKFAAFIHKVCYFDYLGVCSKLKLRYWIIYIVIFVLAILILSPPETPEFIYFAF
ncbi:MAG TPA: hypothetical protein O0W90_00125 [Methanocorpusculum sp.]|nr:hypothetical protein [Methanocorpusculum sp.]